jgi:hypothetical protein
LSVSPRQFITPISRPARIEIDLYLRRSARVGDVPLFPAPGRKRKKGAPTPFKSARELPVTCETAAKWVSAPSNWPGCRSYEAACITRTGGCGLLSDGTCRPLMSRWQADGMTRRRSPEHHYATATARWLQTHPDPVNVPTDSAAVAGGIGESYDVDVASVAFGVGVHA